MSRRSRPAAVLLALAAAGAIGIEAVAAGDASAQSATPPVSTSTTPSSGPSTARDPIGGPLLAQTGVVVNPLPGGERPPAVGVRSYLVADLETGAVLAAKAPHRRFRPASTLKILTGLALLPRLDEKATYRATYDDAAQIGSAVGVVEGHRYTIDQLFLGMFLQSGNDAAHALATAAGGMKQTVAMMRQAAAKLQALDTTVVNVSGLDADGQYSSAYDLALIARAGLQRADFRRYVATEHERFPGKTGETFAITNQNELLGEYPGAIGVKTGYTTLAKNTFVAAATRQGRTVLVTMMRGTYGIHEEAKKLLDWAFADAGSVQPVGRLVDPAPHDGPAPASHARGAAGAAVAGSGGSTSGSSGLDQVRARFDQVRARVAEVPRSMLAAGGAAVLFGFLSLVVLMRRRRRRRALDVELAQWMALRSHLDRYPAPGPEPGRPPHPSGANPLPALPPVPAYPPPPSPPRPPWRRPVSPVRPAPPHQPEGAVNQKRWPPPDRYR